jgi:hypothetical protein
MRRLALRFAVSAVVLAALTPSSDSQQAQPPTLATAALTKPDTEALQSYLAAVVKAKTSAQQAWDALRTATQSSGAASNKDFATDWLATAAQNGAAASPFYAGTESLLESWLDALRSGSEPNLPSDEIRAAMEKWQQAHADILDSLQQSAALEKTLHTNAARIAKLKPESDDWLYYKDQQQQAELTQRKLLSDAGSALAAAAAIPAPISDADRTPSPFAGQPNLGKPDRLFLHLRQASALVGESIPVQIGFADDLGPNVIADQTYSVSLACEGCTAQKSEFIIHKDQRFFETKIKITATIARLSVKSPAGKPASANAFGCYRAPSVALAAEQDRSTGAADGVTPIPFRFAFHDSTGQRATDGRRKSIAPKLSGVGQRISLQQSVASIRTKDGSIVVPANECVAEEGVVSALVGSAKVSADYNSRLVGPLEFRFLYAFPWLDKICIALGVLFGFIANYSILRRRHIHWLASLFSSAIGAAIVFAVGYTLVLNSTTVQDTWFIALGLATIGGVLGVSAAKLVVGHFAPHSDESTPSEELV